jgi:hypothetical protein
MADGVATTGPTGTGPTGTGRLLVAVYALLAVAATSRAAVQIVTSFGDAPVAYALSAVAAVVYVVATAALARRGTVSRQVAFAACSFELAGVLTVGTLSLFDPEAFPDETVWSGYGYGYLFLPLALPVAALVWLRRSRLSARTGR